MSRLVNGEKKIFSTNGSGKTGYSRVKKKKNEVAFLPNTIGKN